MLDILRKKASSWITKFLLGLIAVVFIFFFGYTGLQQGGNKQPVVAKVNGEPIFQNEVNQLVQNQLEFYKQIYKEEIPETLIGQIRQSALTNLIEDRILRASAHSLGMRVSDAEIYQKISTDPSLQINERFDSENYRTVFRPWFLNRYGIDYEEVVSREILKEKFTGLFSQAVFISDEELKNRYLLDHTKIKVKSIQINSEQNSEDDKNKSEALAEEFWPLFKSGKSLAEKLKSANLTEQESSLVPITGMETLLAGQFDPETAAALLRLNLENPYPEKPLRIGQSIFLFKLIQREEPDWKAFEQNKSQEQERLRAELGNQFYKHWYQASLEKAHIKIIAQE